MIEERREGKVEEVEDRRETRLVQGRMRRRIGSRREERNMRRLLSATSTETELALSSSQRPLYIILEVRLVSPYRISIMAQIDLEVKGLAFPRTSAV